MVAADLSAGVTILPLCAALNEVSGPLAAVMRGAWPEWYGPSGDGDAESDLARRRRDSGLPYGMVALRAGTRVGTVAIAAESYGALPRECVWLTGLVVAPDMRGRGIASALVAAIEAAAATASFTEIHTTTITAQGLMRRRGWREVRRLPDE